MKFPLMWFIEYKPTDSYLPLSHRHWHSRSPSNWTSVKPAEQGTSIPRLFASIKSAAGAMARYREGIHQNEYEDGIAVYTPKEGKRKPEDYKITQVTTVECLMDKPMIFVFGSNEAGIHGAGAARDALDHHGAILGKGHGHYGQSYALPTKSPGLRTLNYNEIHKYVDTFIAYAKEHSEWSFKVTAIGTGLAGLDAKRIAAMFHNAPDNCYFDSKWKDFLKPGQEFWGTF